MSEISVIIPVFYKDISYIQQMANQLDKQTYQDFEALFIINGLPSEFRVSTQEFPADIRFHYLFLSQKGVSHARNFALSISRGDYVCFVDCDDKLDPTYFEELIQTIKRDRTNIAICEYEEISEKEKIYYGLPNIGHSKYEIYDSDTIRSLIIPSFITRLTDARSTGFIMGCVWRSIYSKSYLDQLGARFDESVFLAEDLLFCISCYYHAGSISVIHKPLYKYLIHKSSTMRRYSPDFLESRMHFNEVLKKLLLSLNYNLSQIGFPAFAFWIYASAIKNASLGNKFSELKEIQKCFDLDKDIKGGFKRQYLGRKVIYLLMKAHLSWVAYYLYKIKRKINKR